MAKNVDDSIQRLMCPKCGERWYAHIRSKQRPICPDCYDREAAIVLLTKDTDAKRKLAFSPREADDMIAERMRREVAA